jgi:hypothetical protein
MNRKMHFVLFCLLPSTFILPRIAPARNRTWNSSFAGSRGLRSTTGTLLATRYSLLTSRFFPSMPPPGFEPGTQRSKRRMIIRFNTKAIDSSFILQRSSMDSEPVAGFEPATHPYEGRVMPTSPIGPNEKTPRPLSAGLGAEKSATTRAQRLTRNNQTDRCAPIDGSKACIRDCDKPPIASMSVSRVGKR